MSFQNEIQTAMSLRDPEEMLTLKDAAAECGLSKATIKWYVKDEQAPLAASRDENGWMRVRRGDLLQYLVDNPSRCREKGKEIDRTPVNPEAPLVKYITISEAAERTGYSSSNIRYMLRDAGNPLPYEKNRDGAYLIDPDALDAYVATRRVGSVMKASAKVDVAGYEEIAAFPGLYMSIAEAADASSLPTEVIRAWTHDPEDTLPHVKRGNRAYINKYTFIEHLRRSEDRSRPSPLRSVI